MSVHMETHQPDAVSGCQIPDAACMEIALNEVHISRNNFFSKAVVYRDILDTNTSFINLRLH